METDWLRRIRGAFLMGVAWAAVWAPIAVLAGLIVDPDGSMDEMWVAIGAYPGFLCGALFAVVLGMAEGRRRLGEVPLARAGAWGAVAGVVVGVLPFTIGESTSQLPVWMLAAIFIGSTTLLGAASAVVSAMVSRHSAQRGTPLGTGPAR